MLVEDKDVEIVEKTEKSVKETKTKAKNEKVYRVFTARLNCRETPSTKIESRIKKIFNFGQKITITETTTVDEEVWGKCKDGWILLKYCVDAE